MITYEYYTEAFNGSMIPEAKFDPIASAAFDILSLAATRPLSESDGCKRAQCYESELIFSNGGLDAVYNVDVAYKSRETLGDYTAQYDVKSANSHGLILLAGLPLSPLAFVLLQREGLTNRVICDIPFDEGDAE